MKVWGLYRKSKVVIEPSQGWLIRLFKHQDVAGQALREYERRYKYDYIYILEHNVDDNTIYTPTT